MPDIRMAGLTKGMVAFFGLNGRLSYITEMPLLEVGRLVMHTCCSKHTLVSSAVPTLRQVSSAIVQNR